jgi:pilus assembly protein CpaC
LPWISEVPYLGAAFRHVKETRNEIELLIMVTPELVEAMDANEVPPCGPGTQSTSPSDWELFMKGYLEVPNCCPSGGGNGGCGPGGDGADGPPPEGMMPGPPDEQIPAPSPADAAGRDGQTARPAGAAMARRRPAPDSAGPYNRYPPSKSNTAGDGATAGSRSGPPGFMGPVGYDVVK